MKINRILFISALLFVSFGCQSKYTKNRKYVLKDGRYALRTFNSDSNVQTFYLLSTDSGVCALTAQPENAGNRMFWIIQHLEGHDYKIQTLDGTYLTNDNDPQSPLGCKLALEKNKDTKGQIWIIEKYSNQKFKIMNKSNFYCLSNSKVNFDNYIVELKVCNNRPDEYWYIKIQTGE